METSTMKILEPVLPLHPKSHAASSGNRGSEKYKQIDPHM